MKAAGRRPVPARPAPKSKAMLYALIGGGAAIVVVGIAVAVAGLGGPAPETPPPPKEAPAPTVVRKEPPPPAPAPPSPAPAPAPSPAPRPAPAQADPKEEFRARTAVARKKALERAQEVRREVAQERSAELEAAAALAARLEKRPLTFALKSGGSHKDAVVTSYTSQYAYVRVAGGGIVPLPWDSVETDSLRAASDTLFRPTVAKDQFERGKLFIARRMWKDSLQAFEAAAKIGDGYESRVLEFKDILERLAGGQGIFHGGARQTGPESLLLSYDFREAAQLEDWTPGLTLSGTAAILESKTRAAVALRGGIEAGAPDVPVMFVNDLGLGMKFSATGLVTLSLFVGPRGGYEVDLGPAGVALYRVDPAAPEKERRRQVAKSDKVRITPDKTHELRLRARSRKITIALDRQEGIPLEDPAPPSPQEIPQGLFGFAVAGGRLKIESGLLLQGGLRRTELETRVGNSEVLVRRALDPELEEIRERRVHRMAMEMLGEAKSLALTCDDPYFLSRIKTFTDFSEGYEKLKRELAAFDEGAAPASFSIEEWEKRLNALVEKYPDMPGLYFLRALYHDELQNRGAAVEALRKALELFPEFSEALVQLGDRLLEQYDLDGAIDAANRAINSKPDAPGPYILRARASYARSPAAEEVYLEDLAVARKLDPSEPQAIYFQRVLRRQLRGPRDLGCRFDVTTTHYQVTSDISPEASKRYGEALEAAWGHYSEVFKDVPRLPVRRKPRVAIFQTAENYYTYFELLSEDRGENTLGVFRREFNELVLFDMADREETMHTLFHEAFHHFTTLLIPETPPFWYNEGMAEYMGAITVEDGKVLKKAKILERQFEVLLMLEVDHIIPFERIMCETPREFYGPERGMNYAQAWSMIHFFYEAEGGKHRPLIERYFRELAGRKTMRQAFEAVFKDKTESLEKEWRAYARKLKY